MQLLRRDHQNLLRLMRPRGAAEGIALPLGGTAPVAPWPDSLQPVLDWAWSGPQAGEANRKARLLLLDALGCALAGLRREPVQRLSGTLGHWLATPRAPLSPGAFAAVLAAAMAADGAQDTLDRTGAMPGLAVAPLVLAALESGEARLGEAVAAYALGYEVAGRAAEAALAGQPVAWAVMGATATAARLLRMPPEEIGQALQAAAREPAACAAPPARAITLGVLAAAGGIAPAPDAPPIEPRGPVAEHGRWLLLEGAVRAFAGARPLHHVGAAALALHPSAQGRLHAIRAIRVTAGPEALASCGLRAPASTAEALASLSWAAAAALVRGGLHPGCFEAAALADPMLRALEARVTLRAAAEGAETEVALDFPDGSILSRTDTVPGDPAQPMREPETVAKFMAFAASSLSHDRAVQVVRSFLTGPPEMLLAGRLFSAR